jgi:hypothetical protein
MKRLVQLTFLGLIFSQLNIHAEGSPQLFASYTNGVKSLTVQNCLQTPYNTGTGSIAIHFIVASDFDITNANSIELVPNTGFTITTDLPADRSAALTPTGLSFAVTNGTTTGNYILYIHKIKKATIPYSLNFGSSSQYIQYNTATPDFNGWGYRVSNNTTTPQLTSATSNNSFFLAFNPALATDSLVCNFYASNNNTQTGLSANIQFSNDGITWSTIHSINNNLPLNSAPAADKRYAVLLPVGTQYVQYLLTAKGSSDPNININGFSIKHEGPTAITDIHTDNGLFYISGKRMIINNINTAKSIVIMSLQGSIVHNYNTLNSQQLILSNLPNGIYLALIKKADGTNCIGKFMLN